MKAPSVPVLFRLAAVSLAAAWLPLAGAEGGTPEGETSGGESARRTYRPVPPPARFSPPVLALPDPVHDWGKAYKGERIEHAFPVRNLGGSVLTIRELKPSCGCTSPREDGYKRSLEPGEETRITLLVDTSELKPGPTSKYAELFTNTEADETRLIMKGEVVELLAVKPPAPRVEVVRKGAQESGPTTFTLEPSLGKKVKLTIIEPTKGLLESRWREIDEGKKFEVTVSPILKRDDKTAYQTEVLEARVEVDGRQVVLRVPVSVLIKERIEVTPAKSVYFTRKETEAFQNVVKKLEIQSIGGMEHRFKILKAASREAVFKTSIETTDDGKRYRLAVSIEKAPEKPKRFIRDTIEVLTDDPEVPVITIPAMAQF